MLLVTTFLDRSSIHGIGLFADTFIRSGTVIWRFDSYVDRRLTAAEIEQLAAPCRQQILRYTYREKMSGLYVLCGDDARFFNHSQDPNCTDLDDDSGGVTVAIRNISAGEELTCDYGLFDLDLLEGRYRI